MDSGNITPTHGNNKVKTWCWIIGITAIAILAVIIFCNIVYWLIWIGAATVLILFVFLVYYANKGARKTEEYEDSDDIDDDK